MDKTLLIGKGSIGKRYNAILRYWQRTFDAWDITDDTPLPNLGEYAHVLIASPTDTHVGYIKQCVAADVPYVLSEKPVSKSSKELEALDTGSTDVRMVCNWAYALYPQILKPRTCNIKLWSWHTGSDGYDWDVIQCHYLCQGAFIWEYAPVWHARIGANDVRVEDMDRSYMMMLQDWYSHPERLWGMSDAIEATKFVESLTKGTPWSSYNVGKVAQDSKTSGTCLSAQTVSDQSNCYIGRVLPSTT